MICQAKANRSRAKCLPPYQIMIHAAKVNISEAKVSLIKSCPVQKPQRPFFFLHFMSYFLNESCIVEHVPIDHVR